MGYGIGILKNMGLLNVEAPDLGDLQSRTLRPVAYCTSYSCTKYKEVDGKIRHFSKIKVDHNPNDDTCPRCNHLLLWKME
jgi:hypothetical protein